MSAPEKVHPIQFKLFMGAQEWQESMDDSVDLIHHAGETMDSLWKMKLSEAKKAPGKAHGGGTYESIKKHGFQPEMGHGQYDQPQILVDKDNKLIQAEGHHRIAAAAEVERETGENIWIPTGYYDKRKW